MTTSKLRINYIPELTALLFGRKKPSMVSVNLTKKCNQRCIYCEIGNFPGAPQEDVLTKDDLFWIIDQMALNKIKRLSMCGGEPFLFNDIMEVVAYAWKNSIRCHITSNGMTIHKLGSGNIKILKECETAINISVDSFREGIQEQTRGTALALPNALKSIHVLQEEEIPITVLSVISKHNYDDLFYSLTMAYENGIRQVLYQPVIAYSNYPDKPVIHEKAQLNIGVEELEIVMNQLNRIYKFERSHKISTNVYRILPWLRHYTMNIPRLNGNVFFRDVLKRFYCREVFAVIDISYEGGIQPCSMIPAKVNLKEKKDKDLLYLWTDATHELKDDILNNKYPYYCNGCCHKFSRNMLASVMRYPVTNRKVLAEVLLLVMSRILSRLYKVFFIK